MAADGRRLRRSDVRDHLVPPVQQLAGDATLLYYLSEEAQEGRDAYVQKRPPDFSRFPKRP